MSKFDKVLNKIPYFDGGFRRRITAGFIVTIAIAAIIQDGNNLGGIFKSLLTEGVDFLSSPIVVLLFFFLLFGIGGLVEVLAELFLGRLAGNTAWAFTVPEWKFMNRSKIIKPILIIFFLPVNIFWGWLRALQGQSIYKWKRLESELKTETQKQFESYPESVKDGIKDPFGVNGNLPWIYFADNGSTVSARALARKLENRNKDFLTIVTSFLIATVCVLVRFGDTPIFDLSLESIAFLFGLFYIMPFLISLLLYSYVILVRQSILSILEYNSFRPTIFSIAQKKDGKDNDP